MKYIVCTLMGFLFLTEKLQYNIIKDFLIKRFIKTNKVPDHLPHYTLSLNSIHIIAISYTITIPASHHFWSGF